MNRHLLACLAALGVAATALGGCASPAPDAVAEPATPTEQFRAAVASQPEEIRLAIHAGGVSARQADALSGLAEGWREAEADTVTIQTPHPGPDPAAAYRMSESVRAYLLAHGVPAERISVVGYDAAGQASPPLVVGYLTHKVDIPECGQAWPSVTSSVANKPHPNFGCAVTANMAAQIANPADLLGPRRMDPSDAQRRQDVMGKYRKGETTSSQKDENATGAVSKAVQ